MVLFRRDAAVYARVTYSSEFRRALPANAGKIKEKS
jgi:hypothetical protein